MPEALIHSAAVQNDYLCRVLGECRHGPALDKELGDLVGGAGLLPDPLFTYLRYDAETNPASLAELGVAHLSGERLDKIDGVDFIDEMCEFGRAVAARVDRAHFDRVRVGPLRRCARRVFRTMRRVAPGSQGAAVVRGDGPEGAQTCRRSRRTTRGR